MRQTRAAFLPRGRVGPLRSCGWIPDQVREDEGGAGGRNSACGDEQKPAGDGNECRPLKTGPVWQHAAAMILPQ